MCETAASLRIRKSTVGHHSRKDGKNRQGRGLSSYTAIVGGVVR